MGEDPRPRGEPVDVESFQLFFALLALVALAGVVALVVLRPSARAGVGGLLGSVAAARAPLATIVAGTAMAGSLYFSESANYIPCTLCWYQRIAMYPLVVLGAMAWWRGDDPRFTMAPIAGIGAVISSYHWLLERIPDLDTGACSATVPCDFVWFEEFGFVTLPFMALCGFLAVIALVTLPSPPHADPDPVEV